jgi:uncharacterized protein (DUF2141 family)
MSRLNSWKLAALFSFLVMICLFSPAATHASVTLAVTGPSAGDVLPAGSTASITWNSPGTVDHYDLYYSLNSGTTWTTIPGGNDLPNLGSSMNYSWTMPVPPTGGNVATAKIKVEARSNLNAIVGSAISASFTIQTLKVTSPNGGEIVSPKANPATIAYTMYGPNSAVNTATLSFTTNGGTSWTVIATLPITAPTQSVNLYSYPTWTVPAQTALKTACKVKVDIKNGSTLIATDMSDANFTILPFFSISGVATLNTKPLSGVTMSLSGKDTGTTVTDINGKYTFNNLLPGNYTVSAAKSEYAFKPADTSVALTTANFTTANFAALGSAGPTYTLSGQVSGATGTGVLMTLTGTTGGTVMTDVSGNYSFANLPAGFYTVTPAKTGFTFAPLSAARIISSSTSTVNFTSSATSGATFSIAGKATLGALGLPGVTITMTGAANAAVITDASGNYTIKGLKNGAYTLSAVATGYTFTTSSVNKTVAGANLTGVNFAAAGSTFTVSGHILSANTSTFPLPSITVTLSSSSLKTAMTDSTGFYRFTGVPNGTYTLTPSLAGASTAFYPPNALVTLNGGSATQDFGAQIAYNVSGSVSYTGTKKGRIYVGLNDAAGGPTRLSTSITAPGPFSIRGVPPGTYRLTARMDNLGWGTKNVDEPNTTNQFALQVNVTSGNLINQNIPLIDPLAPTAPDTPQGLAVFPGESSALIMWKGDYTTNVNRYIDQKETADAYIISWTDSTLSTGGTITVPAYGMQNYIQTGLTDGDRISYSISAVDRGLASGLSSAVTVTIGAIDIETPNTYTLSGTVTVPAPVPDSKPLYVGVFGDNGVFFTPLETVVSSQSYTYTVTGIPNGNYQAFAFVDLLQNNFLNVGDMSIGIDDAVKIPVVINNAGATQDIALPSANSLTVAGTNHFSDGTIDRYTLLLGARRQKKLPVKLTLTSGPNVPAPMDIGRDQNGDPGRFAAFIGTGPFRPSAGDTYAFTVTYDDNTTETLIKPVTAVLDSFAQAISVEPVPSEVVPTFNWSAPASPPTPTYTYGIEIDQNGGTLWSYPNRGVDMPSSQNSVTFNVDSQATSTIMPDTSYNWQITVNDRVGNSATYQSSYTSGGSIFDISGTVSGAAPDGVTVSLMDGPGIVTLATTTTSNGGQYSFSSLAPGTYSVVASLATYTFSPSIGQPVTITDTDLVVDFTETAIAQHSISGQVTFSGIGFPGVTVTAAGSNGSSTTTDAGGNYTISGLLSGSTYTITPSKANYTFSSPVTQAIGGSDITGVNFTSLSGSGHAISGSVNVFGLGGDAPGLQGVLLTLDTTPVTTIVTGPTGTYTISNIPDGTYTLTPSFAGTNALFYPANLPVTVSNADQPGQNFGARVTFTVSGTVSYPSGSQIGRVYVSVGYPNGGRNTGLGTSVGIISSSTTTAFTIRGVPPGNYALNAWMDVNFPETGSQLATAPTGSIFNVNVANADLTGQAISIADPSPSSPGVPNSLRASPGDASAFVMWSSPKDGNNNLLADHFNVYYDLVSNPITTATSHLTVQTMGNHDGNAIVSGLTNGQAYHFAVTGVLDGTESSLSSLVSTTIGAPSGPNSVSGTVTYPAADGHTLMAGVYSSTGGIYFQRVTLASSSTSTTFTVSGMPAGSYRPFAVIDMNDDNTMDIGDIDSTKTLSNAFVTVTSGAVTGVNLSLSGTNAYPLLATDHHKDRNGNESYSLKDIGLNGNLKLPVQAVLYGPDVMGAVDLDTAADSSQLMVELGPQVPDQLHPYQFATVYSDATTETLGAAVTSVLGDSSFAQNPQAAPVPLDGTPTFSWSAPSSPPANATYFVAVFQNNAGMVWEYPQDGIFTQTTVTYNTDGRANTPSLAGGTTYSWWVTVTDANNNTATVEAPFYTPGGSIFTISGAVSGDTADGVTMNLTGTLTTSTTTTNGGQYSFTNLDPGTYTVTPSKYGYTFSAPTTTVTITDANPAAVDFTATAIQTYHISGAVSGVVTDGVTINLSGDLATSTTTSNGGLYSFSNIANGTYSVVASLATYTFSPTSIPVTISGVDSTGNNFTSSTIPRHSVSGQVTFNGIGFSGVTVAASGDSPLVTTTTNTSGQYTLSGLFEGETYTITPSVPGYTFTPASSPQLIGVTDTTGVNFATATGSGYNISGTVNLNTFGMGPGLQGVTLSLNTSPVVSAVTTSTGFTISNIPNGNYTLTPSLAGAESAFYPPNIQLTVSNADLINQNFDANVGYTVSGTISYPSGTRTGRVYVVLQNGGTTGQGTSISWPTIVSSQTFTIRGVSPGNYSLAAWMDTGIPETGVINAASPIGSATGFSVTNADVISPDIVISDPTPTLPPGAPKSVKVAGRGSHTALMQWKPNTDANGNQIADHYTIYYDTVTPTLASPHVTVPAGSDNSGHVFVTGLTNGSTYNFKMTATLNGQESVLSSQTSTVINATTGLNTVSGTVSFPSSTLTTGKTMYVVLYNKTNGIFFQPVVLPSTSPASYSIAGVPTSTEPYTPIAVIDMNGTGAFGVGNISNNQNNTNNFVTVSGTVSGVTQTLSGANALPWLSTRHTMLNDLSEFYTLENIYVTSNVKLPVKVTITSANFAVAQIPVPMDVYGGYLFITVGQARPKQGDFYTYHVDYSDGTSEDLSATVSGVLDSFAQNLTVDTSTPYSTTVPLFAWDAPLSPPANPSYSIMVEDQAGGTPWFYPQNGVLTQTSVPYNADGNAPPLVSGQSYGWTVSVIDSNNNAAEIEAAPYPVP